MLMSPRSFACIADEEVHLARKNLLQEAQAYFEASKLPTNSHHLSTVIRLKKVLNDLTFHNQQKTEHLLQLKNQLTLAKTHKKLHKNPVKQRKYISQLIDSIHSYNIQLTLQEDEQTKLKHMLSAQRDCKLRTKHKLEKSRRSHRKFVTINQSTEGLKSVAFSNLIKSKNYLFFANRSYTASKAHRSTSLQSLRLKESQIHQGLMKLSLNIAKNIVATEQAKGQQAFTQTTWASSIESASKCVDSAKSSKAQADNLQQQWTQFIRNAQRYLDTEVGTTAESVIAAWKEVKALQTSLHTQFAELSMTHQQLKTELKQLRAGLTPPKQTEFIETSPGKDMLSPKIADSALVQREKAIIEYNLRLHLLLEGTLQGLHLIKEHSGNHPESLKICIQRVMNRPMFASLDFKRLHTMRTFLTPRISLLKPKTVVSKRVSTDISFDFLNAKVYQPFASLFQSIPMTKRFLTPKRSTRILGTLTAEPKNTKVAQVIQAAYRECQTQVSHNIESAKSILRTASEKSPSLQNSPEKLLNRKQVNDLLRLIFQAKFQGLLGNRNKGSDSSRFNLTGWSSHTKISHRKKVEPKKELPENHTVLRKQLHDLYKLNSTMKTGQRVNTFNF